MCQARKNLLVFQKVDRKRAVEDYLGGSGRVNRLVDQSLSFHESDVVSMKVSFGVRPAAFRNSSAVTIS